MITYNDVIRAMTDAISDKKQKYYTYQPPKEDYAQWIPMRDNNYGRVRYVTTGSNVYTTPELYGRNTSQWIIDESNTEYLIDWLRKQDFIPSVTPLKKVHTKKDISIEEFDRLLMGDENGNV